MTRYRITSTDGLPAELVAAGHSKSIVIECDAVSNLPIEKVVPDGGADCYFNGFLLHLVAGDCIERLD